MNKTIFYIILLCCMYTIKPSDCNAQHMIQPDFLKPGDVIRVVAPAGVVDPVKTKAGIALWEKQGYTLVLGKHIYDRHNRFAGTDANRLQDLQEAMNDSTCKAIVCVRGGYGSIHLVNKLDFSEFNKHPKWLIGFSDITVLHEEFQKQGYKSIHGPMVASSIVNNQPGKSFEYLMQILKGEIPTYQFLSHTLNRQSEEVEGELIGGNLSILYSLLGDTSLLNTNGKILFVEDLGEQLYHLDRMIYSLKQAGKLDHIKALLVGEFIDMKDTGNMNQSVEEIIWNAVKEYNFPVYFNFPAGHGDNNYPLIFGEKYQLKPNESTVTLQPIN
ncbi:MAG: LD-carboxypeptidase [Mangrovibacterium sp.]